MSDLLAIPWYRDRIRGHQEVMIGYSDSAKDAGRMSATGRSYRAQEAVVDACEKSGVRLTLFHGTRRQHRPRRRSDVTRHSVPAAGLDSRHRFGRPNRAK